MRRVDDRTLDELHEQLERAEGNVPTRWIPGHASHRHDYGPSVTGRVSSDDQRPSEPR